MVITPKLIITLMRKNTRYIL